MSSEVLFTSGAGNPQKSRLIYAGCFIFFLFQKRMSFMQTIGFIWS